jgi:hypothetical protein
MLIFGGFFKVEKSLYTQVNICVNVIPYHIDTMAILSRYCMKVHGLYIDAK